MAFMAGSKDQELTFFAKTEGFVEETYFATAGQTVFHTAYQYAAGMGTLNVLVNGVKALRGVDYLETDDTTITFISGLNLNDEVTFQIYRTTGLTAVGSGQIHKVQHSGDGSTVSFAVGYSIGPKTNIDVYVGGIYKQSNEYSVVGGNVVFVTPPVAGTNNIEFVVGDILPIGSTTADNVSFDSGASYSAGSVGLAVKNKAENINPSTSGTLTHSGDIVLSGSGKRITGDFSSSTLVNRLMFQTSTVNGNTAVGVLPNGTASTSTLLQFNNSDPTNSGFGGIQVTSSLVNFLSGITGTGTYLPMTFYTGGSERMRIDADGKISINNSTKSSPLVDNDLSFDLLARNNFTCTLAAGGTLTFTNIASAAGQSGTIILINGSNYVVSKAASTKTDSSFLSLVSSTGTYRLSYYCDGTNVYVTTSGALR